MILGGDFMKPINTNKEYQEYVNQKSPNSPIFKNCFNSFWVGGLICAIGQIIMEICKYRGLDIETSATIVSISLIYLIKLVSSLVQAHLFLLLVLLILLFHHLWSINLKDMLWE